MDVEMMAADSHGARSSEGVGGPVPLDRIPHGELQGVPSLGVEFRGGGSTSSRAKERSSVSTSDLESPSINGSSLLDSPVPLAHLPRLRSGDTSSSNELVSGIVRSNERLLRTQTRDRAAALYFQGEQEEGVEVEEIKMDEALQEVWKIEAQDIAFEQDENGAFKKIGKGGCGSVYLGTLFGNTTVAIKAVDCPSHKEQQLFAREIMFLKACRHPNICTFIGACHHSGQTFLVMEHLPGDLYHYLRNNKDGLFLWYNRGRGIALDVSRGLSYLHSHNILHLDIKSPNILLSVGGVAKISDIGLAKTVTRHRTSASSRGHSKLWSPPEQMIQAPCSKASDVYALGTVIWELCSGEKIAARYLRDLLPHEAPPQVQRLIRSCRTAQAEDRPTAHEVHAIIAESPATPGTDHPPL